MFLVWKAVLREERINCRRRGTVNLLYLSEAQQGSRFTLNNVFCLFTILIAIPFSNAQFVEFRASSDNALFPAPGRFNTPNGGLGLFLMQLLQTGKFSNVSFLRKAMGSIPFCANECYKIGSVPFQSMTAFFHLQRKSLVKLQ